MSTSNMSDVMYFLTFLVAVIAVVAYVAFEVSDTFKDLVLRGMVAFHLASPVEQQLPLTYGRTRANTQRTNQRQLTGVRGYKHH